MSEFEPVYKKPVLAHNVMSNQSKTKWQHQRYPAHVLVTPGQDGKSDYDNVMEKMESIRREYKSI